MSEPKEDDFMSRIKEIRKNLKYFSAVSKTEPVAKIPVNSSELEKLDRSIREKCRQNHLENNNIEDIDSIYYNGNQQEKKLSKENNKEMIINNKGDV